MRKAECAGDRGIFLRAMFFCMCEAAWVFLLRQPGEVLFCAGEPFGSVFIGMCNFL